MSVPTKRSKLAATSDPPPEPPPSAARGSVADPAHRAIEGASFVLASLLAIGAVWRLVSATSTPLDRLVLVLAALLGYLLADFFSAVVHWSGDTLGDERTPLLGRGFIRHFRYHHVDEKEITRHDFLETNGNSFIYALPVFGAAYVVVPSHTGALHFTCALTTSTFLILVVSNHFHLWAHADRVPRWVRALQRARIILSPEHHRLHHTPPFDTNYCITVGWVDPLLERIRFFRHVERLLIALGFGAHVHGPVRSDAHALARGTSKRSITAQPPEADP